MGACRIGALLHALALGVADVPKAPRAAAAANARRQAAPALRDRGKRTWPNRTHFSADCGHEQVLGTCPGYAECMDVIESFRENDFLEEAQSRLKGGPPLELARPWCSKWSCINHTACTLPFKVYEYTSKDLQGHPLADCLATTNLSNYSSIVHHVTLDPTRACVYWFEIKGGARCKSLRHAPSLPFWHGNGLNHIFIDHSDAGIDVRDRVQGLGRAAIAQGHATAERWVHGLDIALALYPKLPHTADDVRLAATAPWNRRFLLTFKGTYSHVSRVRAGMHHDRRRGTIIATFPHAHQCLPSTSLTSPFALGTKESLLPLHVDCCQQLKRFYAAYDYRKLMNTTFALVMPGRQPASYRLAEVLARGSIPVFFGFEDAMLPYAELIDWSSLSMNVPVDVSFEQKLFPLLESVRDNHAKALRMQLLGLEVFHKYFRVIDGRTAAIRAATDPVIVETLRKRFELEMRR